MSIEMYLRECIPKCRCQVMKLYYSCRLSQAGDGSVGIAADYQPVDSGSSPVKAIIFLDFFPFSSFFFSVRRQTNGLMKRNCFMCGKEIDHEQPLAYLLLLSNMLDLFKVNLFGLPMDVHGFN